MVAQEKRDTEARQATPLIMGLAAHLHSLWEPARIAKKPIEDKMLVCLRQRNGEYEADKLASIREQGGSEVYMMLTETKCRGAESWLRDILLDDGDVPWDIQPTPVPTISPDWDAAIHESFAKKVIANIQNLGQAPDAVMMDELKEAAVQDVRFAIMDAAQERCDGMKRKINDQFDEGGLFEAFNEFISDLVTYPNAWVKGPIVRKLRRLDWIQDAQGYRPDVKEELSPVYKRVDPYRIYPEPGISNLDEGYIFEHHKLTRTDLADLIDVPGYDSGAIREILDNLPNGGMQNWLWSAEMTKAELEHKYNIWMRKTEIVDALEFWGKVSGKKLVEWGMTPEEVPDEAKEYDVNAWLIGRWVIKATLNYDPLGNKPYHTTSFVKRPGALWGSSIPELIADIQQMCNAAARALNNNMGIASGPQVEVNVERLAADEEITSLTPWKIWQTLNDPLGSGQPAIRFTQPDDRSQQLMQVYANFSKQADDQSGIPAYVYGDMQVGGAGRTASGLSMLMGSAGKGIRQVIMHVDNDVIEPTVTAQFNWNMKYLDDDTIKGDATILAKGAVNLANREQLNVRRIEFLQATANPQDAALIGDKGRAAVLREVAKGLSMPVDDIVPTKEQLDARPATGQQGSAAQTPPAGANVQFQRDGQGQIQGAQVTPPNPATTNPGGDKAGGQSGNTVTNQQTGRS
jgi:hypothetical protein